MLRFDCITQNKYFFVQKNDTYHHEICMDVCLFLNLKSNNFIMAEALQTLSHAHIKLATVIELVKFNIYIFSMFFTKSNDNPNTVITKNNTAKSVLMPHSLVC